MPAFLRPCAKTYKGRWILKLQRLGLDYSIRVLEEADSVEDLDWLETFWILQMRSLVGDKLTNATDGGSGVVMPRTEEWKRKISESQKGKSKPRHSAESRLRRSRRCGGTPVQDSLGRVYLSIADAGRELGLDPDAIRRVIKTGGTLGGGRKGRTKTGRYFKRITQEQYEQAVAAQTTQHT